MLDWVRKKFGGGKKVTSMQSYLDVRKLFEEIHQQLLNGQSDEISEIGLLSNAKVVLEKHPDFVFGSFVYWDRYGTKGFWPNEEIPIFYSEKYVDNGTFKKKVSKTYLQLSEAGLFLSELIHGENPVRALHIEMIHNNNNCCMSKSHAQSCEEGCTHESKRLIARHLDEIGEIFSDSEVKKQAANTYVGIIKGNGDAGYFPENVNNCLIVYCPFLVPNGKPPGSFFGVFECRAKCELLLPLLTDIQLVGTLIFSRMAVDSQVQRLKDKVKELGEYYGQVTHLGTVIEEMELIMHPDALIAGKKELEELTSAFTIAQCFGDIESCHDVSTWDKNARCVGKFIDVLKNQEAHLKSLKRKLGDTLYQEWFGVVDSAVDDSAPVNVRQMAGRIMKAMTKGACPLFWFVPHESQVRGIEIDSGGISPLSFAVALKTCHTKGWIGLDGLRLSDDSKCLHVVISVSNDDKEEGLDSLKRSILGKLAGSDDIVLYSGSNSSLIALLCYATTAFMGDESIVINDNDLALSLVYRIGDQGK